MKRFIITAALALLPVGGLFAAAQTFRSVASGDWNEATTWDLAVVPDDDDTCIIGSGHTVTVEDIGMECGDIDILAGGAFVGLSGSFKVGETGNVTETTNKIEVYGVYWQGPGFTLKFDADAEADNAGLDRMEVESGGIAVFAGELLARGTLISTPAFAEPGVADLVITDLNAFYETDEFAGYYLMFEDGPNHTLVYDIVSNTATTITLDQTSDLHGHDPSPAYTYSAGLLDCDGSNVVVADGAAWDGVDTTLCWLGERGECFVGQDITIDGSTYHIIDYYDKEPAADELKIRCGGGGAACPNGTGLEYSISQWNAVADEPPGWVPAAQPSATRKPIHLPMSGDSYIVYNPTTVTSEIQQPLEDDRNGQINLMADRAALIARYFDFSYLGTCGRDDGGTFGAVRSNNQHDGTGVDGGVVQVDYGEVRHNGCGPGIEIVSKNGQWNNIWVHDSQPTGGGVQWKASSSCHTTNFVFNRMRSTRVNEQDHWSLGSGQTITATYQDSTFEYSPWLPISGNWQKVASIHVGKAVTDSQIVRNVFRNLRGVAITLAPPFDSGGNVLIADNAFISVWSGLYSEDAAIADAFAVNNYFDMVRENTIWNWPHFIHNYVTDAGVGGQQRSSGYPSTLFDTTLLDSYDIRHNIIIGYDNDVKYESGGIGASWTSGMVTPVHTTHMRFEDNYLIWDGGLQTSTVFDVVPGAAITSASGIDIKHNSIEAKGLGSHNPNFRCLRFGSTQPNVPHVVTDNIFAGCRDGLHQSVACDGDTFDIDYNVYIRTWDDVYDPNNCLVPGGNEVTTELLSTYGTRFGEPTSVISSPSLPLTASDGTVRGPRIAGIQVDRIPIPPSIYRPGYAYLVNNIDDVDTDADGLFNTFDNCDFDWNPLQTDTDGDGLGNACDNCPFANNSSQADTDADGFGNSCDNCFDVPNSDQSDVDNDARGDVCDNCPTEFNTSQDDVDGDGIGDVCDSCPIDVENDLDGDGVCESQDNCPSVSNSRQADVDGDGEGDACDLDDGLILVNLPENNLIAWQGETGPRSFNFYRSDLSVLRQTGVYTQDPRLVSLAMRDCNVKATSIADGPDPAAGEIVLYFVTGNVRGEETGLGTDSAGVERPNDNACP